MDLEVYNKDLVLLGIVDNFEVLNWHRKYYTTGTFELTCALTSDNLELLQKENIIYKSDGEAGYIHYRNIKLNKEGKEVLCIKGSFLTRILDRRIIWGRVNFNGKIEELMRKLVNDNCINPSNSVRKIPNLILGELKNYTDKIDFQNSYGDVLEQLEKLAITYGIGYRIKLNYETLKMEFEAYKGLDRTEGQNVNSKALFSRQYENILEQDYVESIGDYKNTCLIAGAGEGSARKLASIEEGQGLDRYELYVDARDLSNTRQVEKTDSEGNTIIEEVPIPDAEYYPTLLQRGNEKLGEHKSIKSFDSIVNVNQENLVYKRDYNLGDKVTIFDEKWNITLDTRITEVEEIYQNTGLSVNVIFGDDIPSVYKKLSRK